MLECVEGLSPNHSLTIDRECGCGLHAQLAADGGLILNKLGVFTRVEAGIKFLSVQAHVGGELLQVVLAESALVLSILMRKQVIMEIPEGTLVVGTFRSFSGPL